MRKLSDYGRNVTSQFGEDGIIEEIFNHIGTTNKFCVEFGAWDGKYLSNTWNLWHNAGWNGFLIEGDLEKYNALVAEFGSEDRVTLVNTYVGVDGESLLDNILAANKVPTCIDLLSIDVDGDEYQIFNTLVKYQPRVVIIEHNPTIPPSLSIVQGSGEYFGASALALQELFLAKGYILACCTETNSIFVISSEFSKLGIEPPQLSDVFPLKNLTYVITSYDGRAFLSQNPVYAKKIEPDKVFAQLKRKLKRYFTNYNENIVFSRSATLLPVRIITNTLYDIRTESLLTIISRKALSVVMKLPKIAGLVAKLKKMHHEFTVVSEWKSAGKPIPPPQVVKQRILKKYARDFSVKCLVETGTYLGDMINATIRFFDCIYSIEIDTNLYEAALNKFKNIEKVKLLCGDSGELLSRVLADVDCQCIFWLDGHYSAGITGKSTLETPIRKEINTILTHATTNHLILIDDARCFDGTGDYPRLDSIIDHIANRLPTHDIFVSDDIIQIIPKSKSKK